MEAASARRARASPSGRQRGRGRGGPFSPPRTRGLARREAPATEPTMGREAVLRKGRAAAAAARRPGPPRSRARGPQNDAREQGVRGRRARRRGPEAPRAHGLQRSRLAARGPRRPWSAKRPGRGTVRVGGGARTLTYLVELFAHIRVNVYVVHTVRHLPSASAAAAAAASCRSARRGSSSGSSGGGGARTSLPRGGDQGAAARWR